MMLSKLEELIAELCPDGVEWKTLGEIGRVSMCKRIMKAETTSDGDIPFFKIGTFGKEPNAFISQTIFNKYKGKYPFPKKGDILISAAGTIGRTVIYDGEPAYYQDSNIVWIDNDESKVLNKYLYYCYDLKPWNVSTGGTIARLYNDNISKAKIPLPPLPIQCEIVRILDNFTELTEELTEELTARKQQYEYYRDSLISSSTSNTVKLKKVVDIYLGLTYTPTYVNKGITFISAQNTSNDFLDLSKVKFISEEEYNKSTSNAKPQKGDLLFTRVGSNLGHPVIVETDIPLCIFVSLGFLRVKESKNIIISYLKHWMKTELFWEQVRKNVHGAAKVNLNTGWLKEFDIILPPLSEQERIVAILDRFDTLTNDITTGLPAEIAARKQQYEYYRDKLLTFKEKE